MIITAIANQKGGCGKTTTAISLADAIAARGRRVLLIDMDPQGHACLGLGIDTHAMRRTVADALREGDARLPLRSCILPLGTGMHVAPSNVALAALEQELAGRPERERRLQLALEPLRSYYDNVIVDCPPSTGLLTFNALHCADAVIAPTDCSLYALQAVGRLLEIVGLLNEKNAGPRHVFSLLTQYDRRVRFARDVRDELERHLGTRLLRTAIRGTIKIREAASLGVSIRQHAPHCCASRDYEALVDELAHLLLGSNGPSFPRRLGDEVLFAFPKEYAESKEVALLGDFNNWTLDDNWKMRDNGDGLYTLHHRLPPGRYEYKFVVAEDWREDPFNPLSTYTTEGTVNSLLVVDPLDGDPAPRGAQGALTTEQVQA